MLQPNFTILRTYHHFLIAYFGYILVPSNVSVGHPRKKLFDGGVVRWEKNPTESSAVFTYVPTRFDDTLAGIPSFSHLDGFPLQ